MDALAKERFCPVCGGSEYKLFAEERIDPRRINAFTYASRKQPEFMCLRLVRCADCDLIYAPNPPATGFLADAYADAAYDSAIEASCAAASYARALQPHLASLVERRGAADVGAGSGPLLPWLQAMGFDPVVGIEPSRAAIEAASAAVRPLLREGVFSPTLLAGMRLSLICSFMTLEHISDPLAFVREAHQLLEPGGMIAIVVHNWQGLLNRALGMRSPIIDVEHLQLFNPKSVCTLLERGGFRSLGVQPIWNAYPLWYWIRLTPLPQRSKSRLDAFLKTLRLARLTVPMRVGNILAVGLKPA